jgi:hypothetical protein
MINFNQSNMLDKNIISMDKMKEGQTGIVVKSSHKCHIGTPVMMSLGCTNCMMLNSQDGNGWTPPFSPNVLVRLCNFNLSESKE